MTPPNATPTDPTLDITLTKTQTTVKAAQGNSCGCTTSGQPKEMDDKMRARIENHPCYSEEAHHHYARMHVAVAPACNIQCNFCNRKYDCANESRPGVVSELLTPEEAAHKALVVAGKIPQMTVLGIAGPGDPLANPEKTFRTFELVREQAPDIKLCLSTNGLMLPDYVDRIKALDIDHVTITINMVDPEIGAKIYPWVHYRRRRYRGIDGVKILHKRQMEGLEALQAADILCKVNSVLIPGINDEHMPEVNAAIRERGAFLHNIMPLISAPEHGTYFGLNGQRGPNPKELKAVQDKCSGNMKLMRHCRQCRADAVGLLGEDRSQEFTKEKFMEMPADYNRETREAVHIGIQQFKDKVQAAKKLASKGSAASSSSTPSPTVLVAVASRGGGLVNQHFGHAKEFMIYEVDANEAKFIGHRKVADYCQGGYGEEAAMDGILQTVADCKAIFAMKIGPCPQKAIQAAGIEVVEDYGVIEAIARKYYDQAFSAQSESPASVIA